MSDSLRCHGPPCPSPTPGVHPNSCPLSRWCHPTLSSFVVPFSSCPQSFPAPGSFPMSQLFTSGVRSIGVSASTSVLPMSTQDRSPLGWTGWISLQSKGLSRVFSNTPHPCCFLSVQSLGHVQLFATPWTVAWQAPLSVGLFRQEYYSGLPFLPPGHLLDPGIKPTSYESSTSQVDSLLLSHWGSPITCKETSLTYPNLTKLPLSFGDSDKHLSKFYCKCI